MFYDINKAEKSSIFRALKNDKARGRPFLFIKKFF